MAQQLKETAGMKWDAFHAISTMRGYKVYEEELEKKIKFYEFELCNNENCPADILKNMQLILKGLKMARSIPRQLENRSKTNRPTPHPSKS